jgi:hypothetical protein
MPASSHTFSEPHHACTNRPLGPQRLARLDGTVNNRTGSVGNLERGALNFSSLFVWNLTSAAFPSIYQAEHR